MLLEHYWPNFWCMITQSLFPFRFINIYVFLTRSLNISTCVFDMNGNKCGKGRHVQWIRAMQCVSNTLLKRTFLSFCRFAIRVIGCRFVFRHSAKGTHSNIRLIIELTIYLCFFYTIRNCNFRDFENPIVFAMAFRKYKYLKGCQNIIIPWTQKERFCWR